MKNVPGRPIISNNGTARERISVYLDYHSRSIVSMGRHTLEGTRTFINRIKDLNNFLKNCILVSFDKVGLYIT